MQQYSIFHKRKKQQISLNVMLMLEDQINCFIF